MTKSSDIMWEYSAVAIFQLKELGYTWCQDRDGHYFIKQDTQCKVTHAFPKLEVLLAWCKKYLFEKPPPKTILLIDGKNLYVIEDTGANRELLIAAIKEIGTVSPIANLCPRDEDDFSAKPMSEATKAFNRLSWPNMARLEDMMAKIETPQDQTVFEGAFAFIKTAW